jgi:cytochrome c oxidase assembly protein subunit 15
MNRAGAPPSVLRRGEVLLVVLVAQAGVGYAQYFTGDPALLVGFHVAGAASVIAAVLWFNVGLCARPEAPPAGESAVEDRPALVAG